MRIMADTLHHPLLPGLLPVHVASKTPCTYFQGLLRGLDPDGSTYDFRYSDLELDWRRYYFAWRFWAVWRSLQRLGSFLLLFGWWHRLAEYRGSCRPLRRCIACHVDVGQFLKRKFRMLDRYFGLSKRVPSWCRSPAVYILYHTLISGRLNLTNVNDSLYDDYLKYLEVRAGRKNVIIFVDDLLNPKVAEQIVQNKQPTAVECSGMIYYFKSKKEQDGEIWNAEQLRAVNGYLQEIMKIEE